jgi:hypothetical protein
MRSVAKLLERQANRLEFRGKRCKSYALRASRFRLVTKLCLVMPVRQAQLGEAILKASSNFYNGPECLSSRGKQSLRDRHYQAELGNEGEKE